MVAKFIVIIWVFYVRQKEDFIFNGVHQSDDPNAFHFKIFAAVRLLF